MVPFDIWGLTFRVGNNCAERWFEYWQKREVVPGKEHTVLEISHPADEGHTDPGHAAMQHAPGRRRGTTK